jgi:hypothetical protein
MRHWIATVAAVALVCASVLAPQTHEHIVGDAEHAEHGHAVLVHTHLSAHPETADVPDHPEWQASSSEATHYLDLFDLRHEVQTAPVYVAFGLGVTLPRLQSVLLASRPKLSRAHSPPLNSGSGLRSPPA